MLKTNHPDPVDATEAGAMPFIPIARPQLGPEEEEAVLAVMRSGLLAQGANVKAFEDSFATLTGAAAAVATSNGTTALYLALLAMGVGPGDEVITSPLTFIASANAIAQLGAKPVFGDVNRTLNLDPAGVERLIGPRTKVIMPVHLHGNPAAMEAFVEISQRRGVGLLQDACQAIGATIAGKPLGAYGAACYSFYATKNLTTGEGGMIITDDPEIEARCRSLRSQAYSADAPYVHDAIGYNYRMGEIEAAIGRRQLEKLDRITALRRINAAFFDEAIDSRKFARPEILAGSRHVYHQYVLRVLPALGRTRDEVIGLLKRAGIGAAVHYPLAVHQQPPYRHENAPRLPNAEAAAADMLSIPVHPAVDSEARQRIAVALNHL